MASPAISTQWDWHDDSGVGRDVVCSFTMACEPRPGPAELRVLPDGYTDVLWSREEGVRVAGPDSAARVVAVAPGTTLIGMRFRTGHSSLILGVPTSSVVDERLPLSDIWGRAGSRLCERLDAAPGPRQALDVLSAALAARLPDAPEPDPLVVAAVAMVRRSPRLRVRDVAASLGVSERHLRRRFSTAVGYGPKTFHRVVRLQRFLALARQQSGRATLTDLALRAGFGDQSHLSNECLRLTGLPPSALVGVACGSA